MFYKLPEELIRKIYIFDNTYREIYTNKVIKEIKYVMRFWRLFCSKNSENRFLTNSNMNWYESKKKDSEYYNSRTFKNTPYYYYIPISIFDIEKGKINLIFERIKFLRKVTNIPYKMSQ